MLAVPTVPVSDFAMYRESANYLSEFGRLDPGFIYMPGFVALLAWVKDLGGDLLAQKLVGVAFGGIGAAGLFVLSYRLLDDAARARDAAASAPRRWRRLCPCPRAATATLIYALWPAGIAMSSVVGTDMPAAALLALALALLVALAPRRDVLAAVAFGVAMGLAAWVRAVALPLSALALGYWLARRTKPLRALALTAIGVAATLVVLLPWGIRHVRQSGQLYFTDDHGGITALIGANPNSEGTYTRALNRMFKDVAGRSVLDEPHRDTDRAAFAIAREWFAFEPRYALGLAVMKADRLFDPEQRLLYWSLLRPGVLVGPRAQWLAAHRGGITAAADWFGALVAGAGAGGDRGGGRAPALAAAGAAAVHARAGRDVHAVLRRAALPAADRAPRVPVRGAGAGRDRGRRARRRAPLARGRDPRGAGAGAGAGAGRRLACRVAGRDRLGRWPARAPPLGDLRGRARRAEAPAAVGAAGAGHRRLAARRRAGGRVRARTAARRPSRCACGWAGDRCRPANTRSIFPSRRAPATVTAPSSAAARRPSRPRRARR